MKKNNSGFTIIEVVLVLAIAGLIFLAVFIALPALQRGQRDTQRRSDAGTFMSQLQSYATNNNGKLPSDATSLTSFVSGYLRKGATATNPMFVDPKTGSNYTVSLAADATAANAAGVGQVRYLYRGTCNGTETASEGTNNRQAAVVMGLEGAGRFCKDMGV